MYRVKKKFAPSKDRNARRRTKDRQQMDKMTDRRSSPHEVNQYKRIIISIPVLQEGHDVTSQQDPEAHLALYRSRTYLDIILF